MVISQREKYQSRSVSLLEVGCQTTVVILQTEAPQKLEHQQKKRKLDTPSLTLELP
jgi:hypothetical protein